MSTRFADRQQAGQTLADRVPGLGLSGRTVVLAVPVAPAETLAELRSEVDDVVCLAQPSPFLAVGSHYDDFHQVEDDEVVVALGLAADIGTPPITAGAMKRVPRHVPVAQTTGVPHGGSRRPATAGPCGQGHARWRRRHGVGTAAVMRRAMTDGEPASVPVWRNIP